MYNNVKPTQSQIEGIRITKIRQRFQQLFRPLSR